ncbi:hypothetical protein ACVJBD_000314 [Rhizobium mongolense]
MVLNLKTKSPPATSPAVADIDTPKSSLIRAGIFGRHRHVPPVS